MTLECKAVVELGASIGIVGKKTLEVSGSCEELIRNLTEIEKAVYGKQLELVIKSAGKSIGYFKSVAKTQALRLLRRFRGR